MKKPQKRGLVGRLQSTLSRYNNPALIAAFLIVVFGAISVIYSPVGITGQVIARPDAECSANAAQTSGVMLLGQTGPFEIAQKATKKTTCATVTKKPASTLRSFLLQGQACSSQNGIVSLTLANGNLQGLKSGCSDMNYQTVPSSKKLIKNVCSGKDAQINIIKCGCQDGDCTNLLRCDSNEDCTVADANKGCVDKMNGLGRRCYTVLAGGACEYVDDCGDGLTCQEKVCVAAQPGEPEQPPEVQQQDQPPVPDGQCRTDDQCAEGQGCYNLRCLQIGAESECRTDAECDGGVCLVSSARDYTDAVGRTYQILIKSCRAAASQIPPPLDSSYVTRRMSNAFVPLGGEFTVTLAIHEQGEEQSLVITDTVPEGLQLVVNNAPVENNLFRKLYMEGGIGEAPSSQEVTYTVRVPLDAAPGWYTFSGIFTLQSGQFNIFGAQSIGIGDPNAIGAPPAPDGAPPGDQPPGDQPPPAPDQPPEQGDELIATGQACPSSDRCASNICEGGVCVAIEDGGDCSENRNCASGVCNLEAGGVCAQGQLQLLGNQAETHQIAIESFTFTPQELTINVGDTVVWTNNDVSKHTVTARDGSFDSGSDQADWMAQSATFTHTFDTAGTFPYYCIPHEGMESMQATIVVGEPGVRAMQGGEPLGLIGGPGELGEGEECDVINDLCDRNAGLACNPTVGLCTEGGTTPVLDEGCASDDDCNEGEGCHESMCYSFRGQPQCVTDDDCDGRATCSMDLIQYGDDPAVLSRLCRPVPGEAGEYCEAKSDCKSPMECNNNKCSKKCLYSHQCGENQVCYTEETSCLDVHEDSQCVQSPDCDDRNKQCKRTKVQGQFKGVCEDKPGPRECNTDDECKDWNFNYNSCRPAQQGAPKTCHNFKAPPNSYCATTGDCSTGTCRNNKCYVPPKKKAGESCSAHTDCDAGLYCANKKCAAKKTTGASCSEGAECTKGCQNGKCKVVCTELNRQGFMPDSHHKASADFADQKLDKYNMIGYHYGAKPTARLMKKSSDITEIVKPVGLAWGRYVAHQMGVTKKEDQVGEVVLSIAEDFSHELGVWLVENGMAKSEISEEAMETILRTYLPGLFDGTEEEVIARIKTRMPLFYGEIKQYAMEQKQSKK